MITIFRLIIVAISLASAITDSHAMEKEMWPWQPDYYDDARITPENISALSSPMIKELSDKINTLAYYCQDLLQMLAYPCDQFPKSNEALLATWQQQIEKLEKTNIIVPTKTVRVNEKKYKIGTMFNHVFQITVNDDKYWVKIAGLANRNHNLISYFDRSYTASLKEDDALVPTYQTASQKFHYLKLLEAIKNRGFTSVIAPETYICAIPERPHGIADDQCFIVQKDIGPGWHPLCHYPEFVAELTPLQITEGFYAIKEGILWDAKNNFLYNPKQRLFTQTELEQPNDQTPEFVFYNQSKTPFAHKKCDRDWYNNFKTAHDITCGLVAYAETFVNACKSGYNVQSQCDALKQLIITNDHIHNFPENLKKQINDAIDFEKK